MGLYGLLRGYPYFSFLVFTNNVISSWCIRKVLCLIFSKKARYFEIEFPWSFPYENVITVL
jgi:hypothetical protein